MVKATADECGHNVGRTHTSIHFAYLLRRIKMTKQQIIARIIENATKQGKDAFPVTTMGVAFVAAAFK